MALAWCFTDEADRYADGVLDALARGEGLVPGHWPLEVVNVLLVAERHGRLDMARSERFLAFLEDLPIAVDDETALRARGRTLALAREHGLTAYDAAYLELAVRGRLPLATRDRALRRSCRASGVTLFRP